MMGNPTMPVMNVEEGGELDSCTSSISRNSHFLGSSLMALGGEDFCVSRETEDEFEEVLYKRWVSSIPYVTLDIIFLLYAFMIQN